MLYKHYSHGRMQSGAVSAHLCTCTILCAFLQRIIEYVVYPALLLMHGGPVLDLEVHLDCFAGYHQGSKIHVYPWHCETGLDWTKTCFSNI